ncbi:DegV family protein [Clostridium sp. CM027]|uniref:DegV family protein n=1 Tax=Clostridium sp. CM027 TaxID=2849865 RepID=UPI001C6E911A|nr:DegV family protein [Clostridium sp. CM027]MBW9144799.1 DegV family protein [Clostridium sp. CM027]UVE40454.1 DegV family protein [Clostridium sp. CM027]
MRDFVIMTDSCCDLPKEYIYGNNIPFAMLPFSYNGREYLDDLGQSLSHKQFFDDLREGALPNTSQANSESFYKIFKSAVENGKDVIYIGVSSGLSGTYNSANIGKTAILEEFPNSCIYIVDVLTASLGQGLMVKKAVEMKNEGYTLQKIVCQIEENIQNLNTYITVQDLNFLKRGGRISNVAATLGLVLHIKPILTINQVGRVMPVLKVRGRKKSLTKLAEIVKEKIKNPETQTIAICHADCYDEAVRLKEEILAKVVVKEVIIHYIGPVVGRFSGPGALAVFFIGESRQHHVIDI